MQPVTYRHEIEASMATLTRHVANNFLENLTDESVKNPVALNVEQQKDILDYTYNLLTDFNRGIPPKVGV